MESADPATAEADPDVAATVRLLHRRRGWIWTTVVSAAAWLVACGLLGTLAPGGTGAGVGVASVFILLLTIIAVAGLVASIVDTVRLHRMGKDVRTRAAGRTSHHPATAHLHRYPPHHVVSWLFAWAGMVIVLGVGVALLPALVNGVAYLAGAENSTVFIPASYGQICNRGGCSTVTNGYLGTVNGGATATWPGQLPLGQPYTVRQPLVNWGFGSLLNSGDGDAIGAIITGGLIDGFSVLILFAAGKLSHDWLRRRRQTAAGLARG